MANTEDNRNYRRTLKGLSVRMYTNQKTRSKISGTPVAYTKQEFDQWLFSQPKYSVLHTAWVASDYNRWLAPSVDRIDCTKGYTLNNIELMTWQENSDKGVAERKANRVPVGEGKRRAHQRTSYERNTLGKV